MSLSAIISHKKPLMLTSCHFLILVCILFNLYPFLIFIEYSYLCLILHLSACVKYGDNVTPCLWYSFIWKHLSLISHYCKANVCRTSYYPSNATLIFLCKVSAGITFKRAAFHYRNYFFYFFGCSCAESEKVKKIISIPCEYYSLEALLFARKISINILKINDYDNNESIYS